MFKGKGLWTLRLRLAYLSRSKLSTINYNLQSACQVDGLAFSAENPCLLKEICRVPASPDSPKLWRPRVRLWHLFALITLAAVLVWLWPRLGFQVDRRPGEGSRAAIVWNGERVELWDTFPPPAPHQENCGGSDWKTPPTREAAAHGEMACSAAQ